MFVSVQLQRPTACCVSASTVNKVSRLRCYHISFRCATKFEWY